MSEVHGYFVDKARAVFTRAGGNPDLSGTLAEWAQVAHGIGNSRRGVIVAEDGTLLAETAHTPATASSPGATYVTRVLVDIPRLDERWVANSAIDLAIGTLQRVTGQGVCHVKYGDVCQGAGCFARETPGVDA